MRRRLFTFAVVAAALVGAALPAGADSAHPAVVSTNPVDFTPNVLNGTVYALALVGGTVVVGGDFSTVRNAGQSAPVHRFGLFAYDLRSGQLSGWAPDINGQVEALAAGPGGTVYVGGTFTRVDGTTQRGVTQYNLASGQRVGAFRASVGDGDVRALKYDRGWLYVGGSFSSVNGQRRIALARVDGYTGGLDPGLDVGIAAGTTRAKVDDLAVSPDGSRMVILGAIESVSGLTRPQLAMIDLSPNRAWLSDWYTSAYAGACYSSFDTYLRAVDFSPGGDYFVVVGTGKLTGPGRMCDTAARFQTAGGGPHNPVWVNYTGGNSLFAVDVTGPAVYVGGHEQWLDNPGGNKSAGPGAVERPGIGAIDPNSGRAMAWNPTRTRGVGVEAFLSTPAGLIVGSDTEELGHEYHARLGMFPIG